MTSHELPGRYDIDAGVIPSRNFLLVGREKLHPEERQVAEGPAPLYDENDTTLFGRVVVYSHKSVEEAVLQTIAEARRAQKVSHLYHKEPGSSQLFIIGPILYAKSLSRQKGSPSGVQFFVRVEEMSDLDSF